MAGGTFVSLLVATVAMLVVPRLSQAILDEGIAQRQWPVVIWMSLAMVGLARAARRVPVRSGRAGGAHGAGHRL